MIYIRDEGGPIKNGLNFYPINSESNIGVVIRIRSRALFLRYSKITKKLRIHIENKGDLI